MIGLVLLVAFQAAEVPALPAELAAALTARQSLNAQIDWEAVPPAGSSIHPHQGRNTYVGSDTAYEVHYPTLHTAISGVDHAMFRGLYWHEKLLENNGSAIACTLYYDSRIGEGAEMDWRVIGMHTARRTAPQHDPFSAPTDAIPSYTVRNDGPMVVVSRFVQSNGHPEETRWRIDPDRDWNVVECQRLRDGAIVTTVATTLHRFGNVWFPEMVEYAGADGQVMFTYKIRDVRMDDPRLPKKLTPEFIGVEPGTNIEEHRTDGSGETVFLDGDELISLEEYARRRKEGRVKPGPAFLHDVDRVIEIGAKQREIEKYTPSEWERYVLYFVQWYRLDAAQTEKAWSIYRDCRERGDQYVKAHASEFEAVARQEKEAKDPSNKPDPQKMEALSNRAAELRRPVEAIFSRELVPRLHKLPTRQQMARDKYLKPGGVPSTQGTSQTQPALP